MRCIFHRWSNWGAQKSANSFYYGTVTVQQRECVVCGRVQTRWV